MGELADTVRLCPLAPAARKLLGEGIGEVYVDLRVGVPNCVGLGAGRRVGDGSGETNEAPSSLSMESSCSSTVGSTSGIGTVVSRRGVDGFDMETSSVEGGTDGTAAAATGMRGAMICAGCTIGG